MASSSESPFGKMHRLLASCPRGTGKVPTFNSDILVLKFSFSFSKDFDELTVLMGLICQRGMSERLEHPDPSSPVLSLPEDPSPPHICWRNLSSSILKFLLSPNHLQRWPIFLKSCCHASLSRCSCLLSLPARGVGGRYPGFLMAFFLICSAVH